MNRGVAAVHNREAEAGRRWSVQVARALAALAVVFVHMGTVSEHLGGPVYGHGLWQFGQAGVDIFFLISGFIMAMVISRPQRTIHFVGRRMARILPFYWLFTLIAVVMLLADRRPLPDIGHLAASLAVLPQYDMPVLGVGWSLEHEFIFYAIVAALLAIARPGLLFAVMVAVASVSVLFNVIAPDAAGAEADRHLLSLYQVQFLMGVAIFRFQARLASVRWLTLLVAGAILFPVSAAILHLLYQAAIPAQPYGLLGIARVFLWGTASALVLCGLIACEMRYPQLGRFPAVRALAYVGSASYALYVSHPLVLDALAMLLRPIWPTDLPPAMAAIVAVSAAVAFALAFYRYVEGPIVRRLDGSRLPKVDGPA